MQALLRYGNLGLWGSLAILLGVPVVCFMFAGLIAGKRGK